MQRLKRQIKQRFCTGNEDVFQENIKHQEISKTGASCKQMIDVEKY